MKKLLIALLSASIITANVNTVYAADTSNYLDSLSVDLDNLDSKIDQLIKDTREFSNKRAELQRLRDRTDSTEIKNIIDELLNTGLDQLTNDTQQLIEKRAELQKLKDKINIIKGEKNYLNLKML